MPHQTRDPAALLLQERLMRHQRQSTESLIQSDEKCRQRIVSDWRAIEGEISRLAGIGLLDSATRSLACAVAQYTKVLCRNLAIFASPDPKVEEMVEKIGTLVISHTSNKRRHEDHEPRPKRSCHRTSEPPATSFECDPNPVLTSKPPPPSGDHSVVRLWFLNNLAYPYPTASQKEKLAVAAGIARGKVDSDLTNFRRRAGWTDILNKWADGNREKMRKLMDRVASGKEKRQEVLKAVEKCQDYLTERETKRIGDWVNEIAKATASEPASSAASKASTASTKPRVESISSSTNDALRSSTPRSFSGSSAAFSDVSDASVLVPISSAPLKRGVPDESISPFKRARNISSSSSSSEVDRKGWTSFFPRQQMVATPDFESSGFHIGSAVNPDYSSRKRHTLPQHQLYPMPPPAYSAAPPPSAPLPESWALPQEWEFNPEIQWGEGQ
ncbi:hypothetical protein L198_04508 [Cryptococcus wingfieldii CBS 7118]|uniref:KN homeodomain domain-containing protein n=1 Tax=Cryptococcus wingfieldii CBS 7118 TaxID=1295528 RepID=A0A1E3J4V3_9TREE|nr:hypothetical protein L198_04508 [Cryptococcus wingfieldii CBS 7118]ODN95889.1 hypothetical protein L198_04508 [Cryptococcus wingfieldii CBS 7118]